MVLKVTGRSSRLILWIVMIASWAVDRALKFAVQSNMQLYDSIAVIPGFFHLTYIHNPGAAFGLLPGRTAFFIVTALLVFCVIIYAHRALPHEEKFLRVVLGMIGGGAFGNLYDRLAIGEVIDYLDFRIWPYIFNFADSMIVIGVGLLMIYLLRRDRQTGDRPSDEQDA